MTVKTNKMTVTLRILRVITCSLIPGTVTKILIINKKRVRNPTTTQINQKITKQNHTIKIAIVIVISREVSKI